jgi:hypothetical protein
MSGQTKIASSPRSDRWPDLLAPNEEVTCTCARSYHHENKQSQHDRALHYPSNISDKNNVHTRRKFNLQRDRLSRDAFGIILHERAGTTSWGRRHRSPPSVSRSDERFRHARVAPNACVRRPTVAARNMGTTVVHGPRAATSASQTHGQIVSPRAFSQARPWAVAVSRSAARRQAQCALQALVSCWVVTVALQQPACGFGVTTKYCA